MSAPWRTLRGRLAISTLVGLLVATVAFTALGIQLVRSQTLKREVNDLRAKAIGIATLMSQDFDAAIQNGGGYNPSPERMATLKAIAGQESEILVTGFSPTPGQQPTALERDVISQVDVKILDRDGVQVFEYNRRSDGQRRLAAAAPVRNDGETVGSVVLNRERSAVFQVGQRVAQQVLVAGAVGLLVALLISTFLTTRSLRPLRRLQTAANAVGQGNLETRVESAGTEEIDALASSFNTMVRELRHRDQISREFLMRITHDLRTPLTAIRGHAQALADGVVPEELVPTSLSAIDGESERLSAMVTDLLDLAKLEARRFKLEMQVVDGRELVTRAFDAHLAEAARLSLDYRCTIPPLPQLTTDPSRVRQILGNLIDNAFRWTPRDGAVDVAATPTDAGGVTITVTDTGPGIPVEHQEEVFEPFRSHDTPDGRSGSGLGLAISQQLARALGGDLYIDALYTDGSRFVLQLPHDSSVPIMTKGAGETADTPRKKATIV